jgi:two-component system, OmpR family, sensor histidine kinase ArlS
MGIMKKKLLNKTLQVYVLFSIVVILVSAPVFYFLTNHLFIHEADEVLFLHKNEFIKYNLPSLKESDIVAWNKASRDAKVEDSDSRVGKDSLFDKFYMDTLNNEDVPYRVLTSPIMIQGKRKVFLARVSLIESEALIKNIGVLFCIILVLLLAGLYLITRILSAKLWKPFYSTVRNLEEFELDKNTIPVLEKTDVEEFDRLNRSASKLLEKNLSIYKNQKEFIENAAHELQTPMALFLAKLDVLVQEVPLTKTLGEAFSSLHESASRIVRLNKNLLLLSKIENEQYAAYEQVEVDAILRKQCDFLREQVDENGIMLHIEAFETLTVKANLTLMEIALSNLLLNSIRHNLSGGVILVSLKNKKLVIANSGVSPLQNKAKLYQRFSSTASDTGSGLGLALVHKISQQHGWQLSYTFANQMHSFEIDF